MTIEERLEKIEKKNESLEKQNRRLRKLAWGAVAIALAGFVGGTVVSVRAYTAAISPARITTQAIILKDSFDRTRLRLFGDSGSVDAFDANGKMRVRLDSSGYVTSRDANGKTRALMGSDGVVAVYDSNGVARVYLNGSDNKIYFNNASGQVVKTLP